MKDKIKNIWEKIKSVWKGLSKKIKIIIISGAGAILIAAIETTVQLTTRAVNAYKEIMQMQI